VATCTFSLILPRSPGQVRGSGKVLISPREMIGRTCGLSHVISRSEMSTFPARGAMLSSWHWPCDSRLAIRHRNAGWAAELSTRGRWSVLV
jgi:hypothetical protein